MVDLERRRRGGRVGLAACGEQADDRAGEGDRDLGEEDRPPVEGLGEGAAERRADRDPEDRGGDPEPPPASRGAAVQQLEGGDQGAGASDRLHRAQRQQQPERVREPTGERREREQRDPGGADPGRADPAAEPRGGEQCEREDRGVDAEDQSHPLDGRVELDQDRG
jgi:hypothetical protein